VFGWLNHLFIYHDHDDDDDDCHFIQPVYWACLGFLK
jgi:hypothetical protein